VTRFDSPENANFSKITVVQGLFMAHAEIPAMEAARVHWQRLASSPWAMAAAVALLMGAIACTSSQRTFLGTGVETDFSSLFAQEALRILRGEPLRVAYHPPGFAFVLASARLLHDGSWLEAGLWISGLSAAAAMAFSVVAWRRLAGNAAAWGVILAYATSLPFRVSASEAMSDMFFTALMSLLLLLVVVVLQSPRRMSLWAACGAIAAAAFLTRTNGIAAAAVLALPLAVPAGHANRTRSFLVVAAVFLLPIAAWVLFAQATGSPYLPVKNHLNIAVAVFGDGVGKWGEQMQRLEPVMTNMTAVLLYDPPRLLAKIGTNLISLPFHIARTLVWPPFALLAVPGLALLLWNRRTPALLVCLGILFAVTLLSGIVDFVARFYLLLIPAIGAMAGVAFAAALERLRVHDLARIAAVTAAFLVCGAVAAWTHARLLTRIESGPVSEFAEAASEVRSHTEDDAVIFARSPSMVLESRRRLHYLDNVANADALFRMMCAQVVGERQPAYVYIGTLEREYRGQLVRDLASNPPSWLEPVARGMTTDWTLYRVVVDQSNAASCSSSSAT
jgi:hypothetical protein